MYFITWTANLYTHAYLICLMALLTSPWEGNKDMAVAILSACLLGCKSAIKELIKFAVLLPSRAALNNVKWITKRNPSVTKIRVKELVGKM